MPSARQSRAEPARWHGRAGGWHPGGVTMRWFERRWGESRGDEYDHWGPSIWLFEVGEDGWPVRQIEVYENGPTNCYGPGHEEDEFGGLGQAQLDELEVWSPWAIPPERFDEVWSAKS